MPRRNPDSAPGDWYIDTACINCAASRHVAPGLIVERGDKSVFARQPANEEEEMMAWRARLVCPTASVRTQAKRQRPEGIFPQELAPGVFRCGFNSKNSYGAHSYFVARAEGNLLVDSPRYALELRKFFDGAGGIKDILLSHRDDVADADKYAEAFGARVWIHQDDARAAPYAKNRIEGMNETKIRDALLAIPVPGHTKGSVVYLLEDTYLFTGDSLAWNEERSQLIAFRDACWYSWRALTDSLSRLEAYHFEWVLPGHGSSAHLPAQEMSRELHALVQRMRT
ncbi:MAG: MBL fold metallo-hydrolase [Betaproteobacteria bacterium]|nr:MAG: MBL fold metallo-hydrolase [Betaproteobacteria bacterium]